jgi:hypothetical protein
MLRFSRRIRLAGRGPRTRGARPRLEPLEGRQLLTAIVVPLPVTGLVATGASASSIALSWNASNDPSVTGYNVYEKVWFGLHGGYWKYNRIASGLTTNSDTITGIATGSSHHYVVTDVNSVGESLYSYTATAKPWTAPVLVAPGDFRLSSGSETTGPAPATVGLTTQVTFYVGGNPLTYAIVSGPPTVSIDPHTGVMTYKPASKDGSTVSVTYQASNALGSVEQTIQFAVSPQPHLPAPTLKLSGTTATYDGQSHGITATAVAKDGVTPVSGTFEYAYYGSASNGPPTYAGTVPVLVTFTSGDPNYRSTAVLTHVTVAKATPSLKYLSSPPIAVGAPTVTLSGSVIASPMPLGDYMIFTIDGVSVATPLVYLNGSFSTTFPTAWLPVGKYPVTYAFAGDANFNAHKATSTLDVEALAAPKITLNPSSQTVTAGDPVSFTAAATGIPEVTVQWQVSTDGGHTFADITGATSTTLTFVTDTSENGYEYRAVFTNSAGTATTTAALLTVESDGGGGGNAAVLLILDPSGTAGTRHRSPVPDLG